MRRFLLDTGAAGDYIERRGGTYDRAQVAIASGNKVGIGMPVLGELFAGVELSSQPEENRKRVTRALASLLVWPFDLPAAREFGRLFASLRRRGRQIQQIDIQIASIAISMGNCTVVTKDRDFRVVPGLDIEDWSV